MFGKIVLLTFESLGLPHDPYACALVIWKINFSQKLSHSVIYKKSITLQLET